MLRKVRIASQIFFVLLFVGSFFLINRIPHAYTLPSDLFLKLNPLVALLTGIASRHVISTVFFTGAAVAVISIIFGRVFCGFVCPLGSSIDFADRFLFGKARSSARTPPLWFQRIKYVFLFVCITAAIFGSLFSLFFDPISLFTRFFALLVNPLLAFAGMSVLQTSGPLLGALGFEKLRLLTFMTPVFYSVTLATALFILIYAGSFWDRRFWCQYVCPSGAFFGLLSHFPLFRRTLNNSKCNSCGRCVRVCPTRAIEKQKVERTTTAECIVCGLCTSQKDNCSHFKFALPTKTEIAAPNLKRRHALLGILGGIVLVPSLKTNALSKADGQGRLIRPPGALPEGDFLSRCIACGNCMKACPTNAIQPCSSNDGLPRLFTPKIVPRIGFCDAKCSLCGHTCPTGALRRLPVEEKSFVKIGTAVINRNSCLAWSQNKECQVCDEVCPYNAIEPRLVETTKGKFIVPIVWEDRCMGCGLCENKCPIFDEAAIVVYKFGENRKFSGEYASESQKKRLIVEREKSANDIHEGAAGTTAGTDSLNSELPPGFGDSPAQSNELPPGFSDN